MSFGLLGSPFSRERASASEGLRLRLMFPISVRFESSGPREYPVTRGPPGHRE